MLSYRDRCNEYITNLRGRSDFTTIKNLADGLTKNNGHDRRIRDRLSQ